MERQREQWWRICVAVAAGAVLAVPASAQSGPGERRIYPVPVLGYAPETNLMFGVALAGLVGYPESTARRPTSFLVAGVYTVKSQYSVSMAMDRWSADNRWQAGGELSYSEFPAEFHGIGAQATDSSENYTPRTLLLSSALRRRVGRGRALYAGVTYAFQYQEIVKVDPAGSLAQGTVPGSTGGRAAMLGLEVLHDTRTVLYGPRSGHLLRGSVGVGAAAVGSEFDFRRLTVDARYYRGLGAMTVLALQVVVDAVDGALPFERMPKLGGQSILRGYTEPRFRDNAMAATQLELRLPVHGRFGAVVFGGLGTVAPSLGAVTDQTLHAAGGVGARFLLDARAGLQLRMDFASAPGGGGLYIGVGDAF